MTGRLLAMRLRWYSEATALVLLRRWQAILLWVGTLAPVGGSIVPVASYPVLVLLDPTHGVVWRFGAIGLWQGAWALWALMQQSQLRGGPFADYVRALPIRDSLRRKIDFVVLLVGNTPLLIPFIAAGIALGAPSVPTLDAVRGALLMVFLLATQWCAQHAVLDGRGRAAPALLVANLWAAIVLGLPVVWAISLMLPVVALSIWALMTDVPALPRRMGSTVGRLAAFWGRLFSQAIRVLPPADRLALGILYQQNRSTMLGCFFSCLLLTFAARGLMNVWDFDSRSLPMVIIAFGLLALVVSGLYQPLQMAHHAARPYTASLPLRPRWWVPSDTTAIVCFALPFIVVLAGSLWADAGVPGQVAVMAVACFVLLVVMLRVTQLFSKRHAVLTSTVFTAGWTYVVATSLHA